MLRVIVTATHHRICHPFGQILQSVDELASQVAQELTAHRGIRLTQGRSPRLLPSHSYPSEEREPVQVWTSATIDSAQLAKSIAGSRDSEWMLQFYDDPPIIDNGPGCWDIAPVGRWSDVSDRLGLGMLREAGYAGNGTDVAIVDMGLHPSVLATALEGSVEDIRVLGTTETERQGRHADMVASLVRRVAPRASLIDVPILSLDSADDESSFRQFASNLIDALELLTRHREQQLDGVGVAPPMIANLSVCPHDLVTRDADRAGDIAVTSYRESPRHPLNRMISVLARRRVDIVVAAGNCRCLVEDRCQGAPERTSGINGHPDALSVGAITTEYDHLPYSRRGPSLLLSLSKPDLVCFSHFSALAPKYGLDDRWADACLPGTSVAAPLIAGLLAIGREARANRSGFDKWTAAQMRSALRGACRRPTPAADEVLFGAGAPDPEQFLLAMESSEDPL